MTEQKLFKGVKVDVLEGTTNVGKTYQVISEDPIVIGDSEIEFTEASPSLVSGGTTTPSMVPIRIGLIYIRTTTKDVYVSAGATSSSDWIKVN
jgi:hypothetical protein